MYDSTYYIGRYNMNVDMISFKIIFKYLFFNWRIISLQCCVVFYHTTMKITQNYMYISSVQFSRSVMYDSATPWTAARQASLSITNSRGLLKPMSIESVMPSNHLILCRPVFLLPSLFPTSGSFQMSQFFTSGGH